MESANSISSFQKYSCQMIILSYLLFPLLFGLKF
jgi:hypothetical protein